MSATEWTNPHKLFLQGVLGVVEATSAEKFFLWEKHHHNEGRVSWVAGTGGPLVTIGHINDMPVCMSMLVDEVAGAKFLFIECTSQVVDWRMVDEYLKKHLPQSAFTEAGYINKTDAMNFMNILPSKHDPKIARCTRPPVDWSCSRAVGHSGPCAASKSHPLGMQSSIDSHSTSCNRRTGGTFCDCGFS